MRFFWITDQVILGEFYVQWHPGHENLADYYTKHFDDEHNMEVSPGCLQKNNSPIFLPIYEAPIALQGCVVIMLYKYICSIPLPRIPIGNTEWKSTYKQRPDGILVGPTTHKSIIPAYISQTHMSRTTYVT